MILPTAFYNRGTLAVARELVGCRLVHRVGRKRLTGRIVEVEAYIGERDLACHARHGRTKRTETMYGPAGCAYVYLIYGMYDMLNIVTEADGSPAAVLIRALEPLEGLERPSSGPGKLCRAMKIDRALNGADLTTSALTIERGSHPRRIWKSPRIGVDYAGAWARKPWRFFDPDSIHLSRPR